MAPRQEYARPRPRAIARHLDQPGRAAAPAHTGPTGISPHRVAGPRRATAAATQRIKGRLCPSPRSGLELCPQPRACHRLDPRGVATQTRPLLHSRLPGPAAGAAAPPAPGTAGVYHRRPACSQRRWTLSSGLLQQVAGIGPLPVGVL